jgi:predicted metallopeptidase
MKYVYSDYWTLKAKEIAQKLEMQHIDLDRVSVVESKGSKSRRTIARIHSIGKVMQLGMQQKTFYTIELISEKFYKQSDDEQVKTIIHELMHIPATFGGGFRNHTHHVTDKNVENMFKELYKQKRF